MNKLFCAVFCWLALMVCAAAPVFAAEAQATENAAVAADNRININNASTKELQGLPGVGKVTAERIIEYRAEKGAFTSPEQLLKVKGVGKKTLEQIRDLITLE